MAYLSKHVPTDIDWSPSFGGGYVLVMLGGPSGVPAELGSTPSWAGKPLFHVSVWGGDDSYVSLWDLNLQEASSLYDSLTYIQSTKDLWMFVDSRDNNGWVSDREKYNGDWQHDQDLEDEDANQRYSAEFQGSWVAAKVAS